MILQNHGSSFKRISLLDLIGDFLQQKDSKQSFFNSCNEW